MSNYTKTPWLLKFQDMYSISSDGFMSKEAQDLSYYSITNRKSPSDTLSEVAKDSRTSTVQGHRHTEGYVEYSVSDKDRIYGFQIGCGIDHKHMAFEYAKPYSKKPFIGCGVILDKGQLPILLPMHLEDKNV